MKKKIIIITGATGSGKSKYAIELAQKIGGEIINADSMQIFNQIPIITAQPSENDKQKVKHHLYGFQDVFDNTFSVGKYLNKLEEVLENIDENIIPIIVGGTMMYVDTIVNGINKIPEIGADITNEIREKYKNKNADEIFNDLKKIDNDYASVVDKNNTQRLIRGIEVKIGTGKSILEFWNNTNENVFIQKYDIEKYIIIHNRYILYDRINKRFDKMIENGAVEEAKKIKKLIEVNKLDKNKLPKAIGLQYLLDVLDKKITLETAIELSKTDSRHYAKRQITWFNNRFKDFQKITF